MCLNGHVILSCQSNWIGTILVSKCTKHLSQKISTLNIRTFIKYRLQIAPFLDKDDFDPILVSPRG